MRSRSPLRSSERAPRREPQRRTSEEIVDAILDAAAQLISESGSVDRLTTNHVADCAGVSIGSLYRYFPDKESIVAALDLRYRRASAARFLTSLADFETDFPAAIRRALRAFTQDGDPRVRAAMMRDVPAAWVASNAREIWNHVVHVAASALVRIRPQLTMDEARKRVFFAVHATQGVTWGLLLWPVEGVTRDDMIDLFARHLERILLDPEVGEQVREHPPIDSLRTAMIPRT
jgi:AcrR family transcriptional regulator